MACKVCRFPHAGLHYQTICCRACAAFYKRTIIKKLVYKCSHEENCDVTTISRYSCRFCRMKKCITVGMSLTGKPSTSNGLNSETADDNSDSDGTAGDDLYRPDKARCDPTSFINRMQQKIQSILSSNYKKRFSYTISICEQFARARAHLSEKWPKCRKEKIFQRKEIDFAKGMRDFYKAMITTSEFCMEIQAFAELPLEEKPIVFKNFEHRFMTIVRAYTTVEFLGRDLNDTRFVGMGGQIVDFARSNLKMGNMSDCSKERWKSMLVESEQKVDLIFMRPFKRYHIDEFEMDFLLAFSMWSLDDVRGFSIETMTKSRKIRQRLTEELTFYYKYERDTQEYSRRIYKLCNLLVALDKVTEMRQEESFMTRTFKMLNVVHLDEIEY